MVASTEPCLGSCSQADEGNHDARDAPALCCPFVTERTVVTSPWYRHRAPAPMSASISKPPNGSRLSSPSTELWILTTRVSTQGTRLVLGYVILANGLPPPSLSLFCFSP